MIFVDNGNGNIKSHGSAWAHDQQNELRKKPSAREWASFDSVSQGPDVTGALGLVLWSGSVPETSEAAIWLRMCTWDTKPGVLSESADSTRDLKSIEAGTSLKAG